MNNKILNSDSNANANLEADSEHLNSPSDDSILKKQQLDVKKYFRQERDFAATSETS